MHPVRPLSILIKYRSLSQAVSGNCHTDILNGKITYHPPFYHCRVYKLRPTDVPGYIPDIIDIYMSKGYFIIV
jgi:hypothetical protein